MKPVHLYIKRHRVTGLMYFGKTIKNPHYYLGSGSYWKNHMKAHGGGVANIETVWVETFTDEDLLVEFALFFSEFADIVNSPRWANQIIEDGLNNQIVHLVKAQAGWEHGHRRGLKNTPEHKAKISASMKGRKQSPEHTARIKATRLRNKLSKQE